MDTTKQNILMCEKAVEIQKEWDFKSEFNILYDKVLKKSFLNVTLYVQGIKKDKSRYIWLPRQDQLQGMIKTDIWFEVLKRFNDWTLEKLREADIISSFLIRFNSMEQLWLAFVMKEKYQKVWDEKDWVKV